MKMTIPIMFMTYMLVYICIVGCMYICVKVSTYRYTISKRVHKCIYIYLFVDNAVCMYA